jgi:uncharacterized protein (DUF2126 family)
MHDAKLEDESERARIARVFEQGITAPVGCVLPLRKKWWLAEPCWESGTWVVRSEEMFLTPGDSPMGFRLPLQSLLWYGEAQLELTGYTLDPLAARAALPDPDRLRAELFARSSAWAHKRQPVLVGGGEVGGGVRHGGDREPIGSGNGLAHDPFADPRESPRSDDPANVVRTALCIEPRDGVIHVFMPPSDRLEDYLELVTAIEDTSAALGTPVVIEGYLPPHD